MLYTSGQFIRVKNDHPSSRAGKDGMVFHDEIEGETTLSMVFGFDRASQRQDVQCVGPEIWDKSELDLTTAY